MLQSILFYIGYLTWRQRTPLRPLDSASGLAVFFWGSLGRKDVGVTLKFLQIDGQQIFHIQIVSYPIFFCSHVLTANKNHLNNQESWGRWVSSLASDSDIFFFAQASTSASATEDGGTLAGRWGFEDFRTPRTWGNYSFSAGRMKKNTGGFQDPKKLLDSFWSFFFLQKSWESRRGF